MQAAVMAPTELLAEQHLRNFTQWLEPLGVRVEWLVERLKGPRARGRLAAIADGSARRRRHARAVPGGRELPRLALVIIDEQHRFGVHQRLAAATRAKADRDGSPARNQMVMTATPIPRTLAMSAYADLDTTVIDELPPGRTPVTTVAVPEARRAEDARTRARRLPGGRAYWVCTLVEVGNPGRAGGDRHRRRPDAAAAGTADRPRARAAQGRRQGGRDGALQGRELDLLVATTVIEVGVDVPNASLMIIENAERLGLAQLHQLRGRVGQGLRHRAAC